MGEDHVSLDRRPGCPFDDQRAEDYAHSRAGGATIHVASQHALINFRTGKRLEAAPEMRLRLRELRAGQTITSRPAAWWMELLARNAECAINEAEQEEDGKKKAALRGTVNAAASAALKAHGEQDGLAGAAVSVPRTSAELRAELRRRLSASGHEPLSPPKPGETVQ